MYVYGLWTVDVDPSLSLKTNVDVETHTRRVFDGLTFNWNLLELGAYFLYKRHGEVYM